MAALAAVALSTLAIVAQDHTTLRAAPRESAPAQAQLWQGDSLELRGVKGDYLVVYDHRRERAGYARAQQVRTLALERADAAQLLAVVRFLRDAPGAESLGIGYAAAFLKAAPAEAIGAEVFDALGTMAERLAARASLPASGAAALATTAHLEVAASYGVEMQRFEQDGSVRVCYNGEAFRRVMALPGTPAQKARAALALTRHDCVAPDLGPSERLGLDQWRQELLARVDTLGLEPVTKNRVHLRRAGVWAGLSHQLARRSAEGDAAVLHAGQEALRELAAVAKAELADSDQRAYDEAAVRVGASLWAAQPQLARNGAPAKPPGGKAAPQVTVRVERGQPGQSCVLLLDAQHGPEQPLLRRCTYGIVWQASLALHPQGKALAIAVQPTPTWREMWVFQHSAEGWRADVLPPSTQGPGLGYVEFAGWVPGTAQVLTAREVVEGGRNQQRYELRELDTLQVLRQADKPANLSAFYRWQSPQWKSTSVSGR